MDLKRVGQHGNMIDACLTSLTNDQQPIFSMSKIFKIGGLTEKLKMISNLNEKPWTKFR
jgi:hypothetical protein